MGARSSPAVAKVGAALLVAAAAINLALTPRHFAPHVLYGSVRSGSLGYGIFFLTASVIQILLAAALVLRPGPRVFRAGVLIAFGLIAGWLVARATAAPLVPQPSSASSAAAGALELAAGAVLLVGLPLGGSAVGGGPRFARGWAALAGAGFALLFLVASGSLAHVPFDLAKQGSTPWALADTTGGFGFLSPWLEVAFSRHVLFAASWAVLAFLVVAGALFALTIGLTVGLARCPGACRPQATGIAAVAPAFVAVPTCCGAALPIGATLGGSTLLPMISAAPWLLLATVVLLSANLVLLRQRWRAAGRAGAPVTRSRPRATNSKMAVPFGPGPSIISSENADLLRSGNMASRKRMVVQGMTCDHCEGSVARALEEAGAQEVRVSYRKGEALFRGGEEEALLAKAVREAGYRPGAIESLEDEAPVVAQRANGSRDYDLLVLGSGSAAFAAAIRGSDLGARVALVESATVGGTCVNVGCVPSKAALRAAELQHLASSQRIPGLRISAERPDLAQIVAWKDELVTTLRQEKYLDLVELYGFDLLSGSARFAGPDAVAVNGSLLSADSYLIATGASPAAPPIPGLAEAGYLTSTSALDLTELPETLAVIGANAIGLELGQYFARLGSRVTLIEVLPRIAPFEEPEISETLTEALEAEGLSVLTGATVTAVSREGDRRVLNIVGGGERQVLAVDQLLVATGRRPNTAELGLEAAGVAVDERGAVVADEYLRTANERVLAAGDVTGSPQFVYVSAYEGALAAENALNGSARKLDLSALPRVTFTSPQVAAVGLTESEAREAGYQVKTSLLRLEMVPRAIVNGETRGLIKLVADEASDRLLGAHVLAEHAGEVIQAAVLAVKFKLTVRDLTETFHPYLTIAEGIKLAAQTFGKDVATLSCCAA